MKIPWGLPSVALSKATPFRGFKGLKRTSWLSMQPRQVPMSLTEYEVK
jgi:hypothetical protein